MSWTKDLNEVRVTMGLELKSTDAGDAQSLSFYSDDIRLSAVKGQSDSLVISLPEGPRLHVVGVDSSGTITTAEVELETTETFDNSTGIFNVDYSVVEDELASLGFLRCLTMIG